MVILICLWAKKYNGRMQADHFFWIQNIIIYLGTLALFLVKVPFYSKLHVKGLDGSLKLSPFLILDINQRLGPKASSFNISRLVTIQTPKFRTRRHTNGSTFGWTLKDRATTAVLACSSSNPQIATSILKGIGRECGIWEVVGYKAISHFSQTDIDPIVGRRRRIEPINISRSGANGLKADLFGINHVLIWTVGDSPEWLVANDEVARTRCNITVDNATACTNPLQTTVCRDCSIRYQKNIAD